MNLCARLLQVSICNNKLLKYMLFYFRRKKIIKDILVQMFLKNLEML